MIGLLVVAVVGVVALVALVAWLVTRRREADTVTSFQRQIDALSPEARRQVVDQVHRIERRDEPGDVTGRRDTPATDDRPSDDAASDDEESDRGT